MVTRGNTPLLFLLSYFFLPSPRAKLIRRLRFGEEKIIYVFGGVLQLVPSNMCYILRDVKIACQRKMTQVEVGMFTEDLGE